MAAIRWILALALGCFASMACAAESLPETKPLDVEGDFAAHMVAGMHKYLDRELAVCAENRRALWQPDYASQESYTRSLGGHRDQLRRILGVVDPPVSATDLHYVSTTRATSVVAEGERYVVHQVRWPVFDGLDAEGLLLEPKTKPLACVVVLPDADETPEMQAGLASTSARRLAHDLADRQCRVLVPVLIDRKDTWSGNPRIRMTNQTHREFVYRMAYQLGRHIIGYEVQKVLAAVDWFSRDKDHPPIGVCGGGEGGLIALCSAALDPRIQAALVSGYWSPRESVWEAPIYRNVWSLLRRVW